MSKQIKIKEIIDNHRYNKRVKVGDRVQTPFGDGIVRAEEGNRVEHRFGVELDYLDRVPFSLENYPNGKVLYFFKSELKPL